MSTIWGAYHISEVDAAVAAHIPTLVPDRFTLDSCTSVANDEVYAAVDLCWTDSDEYINVYITDYYNVYDGIYNMANCRSISDINAELIAELCLDRNGEDEFNINIMFEDGVYASVTIYADMTSDEIYKMLVTMATVVIN